MAKKQPLIRIVYWPKDDKLGRRHTSWLRWDTATKPPEDFGKIERVEVEVWEPAKKTKKKSAKGRKKALNAAFKMLEHNMSQYGDPIGKCATGECGHDDSSWCERKP